MQPFLGLIPAFWVKDMPSQTGNNLTFGDGVVVGFGLCVTAGICAIVIWIKRAIERRMQTTK